MLINESLLAKYDIRMTGAVVKQFEGKPSWNPLMYHTCVYACGFPSQKKLILTSLKSLDYITLMVGNGTNDVGALR